MAFIGPAAAALPGGSFGRRTRPVAGGRPRGAAVTATRGRSALRAAAVSDAAPEAEAAATKVDAPADAKAISLGMAGMPTLMDTVAILDVLPHRYPFLLIDKVVAFTPGESAVAVKAVTMNEPQFTGHFPGRPIMPGVLMVEAMAQTGGIVMLQQPMTDGKGEFFFAGLDKVKWRRPVVPGDVLVMEMVLKSYKARFGISKMTGRAYVDGQLAVEGEFTFAMVTDKK